MPRDSVGVPSRLGTSRTSVSILQSLPPRRIHPTSSDSLSGRPGPLQRAYHGIVLTSVLLGPDSRIRTVGASQRFHLLFIADFSLDTCVVGVFSLQLCHLYLALCIA